ncbi:hypothetical protein HYW60_01135 [Candidatus Kaiserbacteria bacterium]|nr:hypothetical protein [Candidatus Kaiserbacteria bacterium]
MMRYTLALFLVALLVMLLGLVFGYLSLDISAPEDRQLVASGALAYWSDCGYDCGEVSPPPSADPTCIISAYPATLRGGESSNLAWGSENTSSAYLSSVGTVAVVGGTNVSPRETTIYTLTVYSRQGAANACATHVNVLP